MIQKIIYSILIYIVIIVKVSAQSPQFTQFQTANLYMNPATSGTSGSQFELSAHHRSQWISLDKAITTNLFSLDITPDPGRNKRPRLESNYRESQPISFSLGLMAMNDNDGPANLNTVSLNAMPTFAVQLNNNFFLQTSLQISHYSKRLNADKILFIDDFNQGTTIGDAITLANGSSASYFDASVGFLLYGNFNRKNRRNGFNVHQRNQNTSIWVGFAMHDLLPDKKLLGNSNSLLVDENNSTTIVRLSLHGGVEQQILGQAEHKGKILGLFNIRNQGNIWQMDIQGGYSWRFQPSPVENSLYLYAGTGFRSFKRQDPNLTKFDAVYFLSQFSFNRLSIGYSYDLPISPLTQYTGGAHEVSISYRIKDIARKKLPEPDCPLESERASGFLFPKKSKKASKSKTGKPKKKKK